MTYTGAGLGALSSPIHPQGGISTCLTTPTVSSTITASVVKNDNKSLKKLHKYRRSESVNSVIKSTGAHQQRPGPAVGSSNSEPQADVIIPSTDKEGLFSYTL